jgi:hypothetical protein
MQRFRLNNKNIIQQGSYITAPKVLGLFFMLKSRLANILCYRIISSWNKYQHLNLFDRIYFQNVTLTHILNMGTSRYTELTYGE